MNGVEAIWLELRACDHGRAMATQTVVGMQSPDSDRADLLELVAAGPQPE